MLLWGIALVLACAGPGNAEVLRGKAFVRERIALPAGLTFEAVIEDISRAGAPAGIIAAIRFKTDGQPPFAFEIPFDPTDLGPGGKYGIRATLHRNGRLHATTDRIYPLFEGGSQGSVEVMLRLVAQGRADPVPARPLPRLALPATFRGLLPCADCEGIRHRLDLWPDGVFHLHREWLGGAGGRLARGEVGRWHADAGRGAILLEGPGDTPRFWQVLAADRLRQMDLKGEPIDSALDYDLHSNGGLELTELGDATLAGMLTYQADAAVFVECLTGRPYPVAAERDYLTLERSYLEARASPGAPLLVQVEGGLAMRPAMEGPDRPSLVVDRFIEALPDKTCAGLSGPDPIFNVYWRITELQGIPAPREPGIREAHLILHDAGEGRFSATVGCNRLLGHYTLSGDKLSFDPVASTMMACPAPLDAAEQALKAALSATRSHHAGSPGLELLDEKGHVLARLEPVHLR